MIRLILTILILLAIAFASGLACQRCQKKKDFKRTGRHNYSLAQQTRRKHEARPVALDTVKVDSLPAIRISSPVIVPVQNIVQTKPDTAARKRAENRTIITGIIRKPATNRHEEDSLIIQRISPMGIKSQEAYSWRWVQLGKLQIDSTGQLHIDLVDYDKQVKKEKRKRTWRKIGNAAIATGAAVGAFILGQQLSK